MEAPFGQRQRLGHCLRCASRLIYTIESVSDGAEGVILARRCPECEFRETVVVSVLDAARRYRHETRVLAEMMELANSLSEVCMSVSSYGEGIDGGPRS
jgi:hypothetical protein